MIDSEGLSDRNGNDKYAELVEFIKAIEYVNLILFVFHIDDQRFSCDQKEVFLTMAQCFNKNLISKSAFVYTHASFNETIMNDRFKKGLTIENY